MLTITTPEGIKIEIDPAKAEEIVFGYLGKVYKITITEEQT